MSERFTTERDHQVIVLTEFNRVNLGMTMNGCGFWFELTADEARKLADTLERAAQELDKQMEAA